MRDIWAPAIDVGNTMVEMLWQSFEKALRDREVLRKVKPFAFDYTLALVSSVSHLNEYCYDPRDDSKYENEEFEPIPLGTDSYIPAHAPVKPNLSLTIRGGQQQPPSQTDDQVSVGKSLRRKAGSGSK